jgi:hypothetical protein
MTVPWRAWWASCTCPGADQVRRRMEEAGVEFADPGEMWEKVQRDSAARSEVFRSARDRAAGRSRDEVREIYLAELRSRGLPVPSGDVVNATVELIMGSPLSAARLMGEGLIETGKLLHGVFKIFRQSTGH